MEYPKDFDPYIDKHIVAECLDYKSSSAASIITQINKQLIIDGYEIRKGRIPASELCRKFKVKRETVIYFYFKRKKLLADTKSI